MPALSEGSGSALRSARSLELVRPAQVRPRQVAAKALSVAHCFDSLRLGVMLGEALPALWLQRAKPCAKRAVTARRGKRPRRLQAP